MRTIVKEYERILLEKERMLKKITDLQGERERQLEILGNGHYIPKRKSPSDMLKDEGIVLEFDADINDYDDGNGVDDIPKLEYGDDGPDASLN
jgi:hypothetical protein